MAQRGMKRRSGRCWQYSLDDCMYRHMRCRKWLEGTACRTLPSAKALDPAGHPRAAILPTPPDSPLHPSLRDCVKTLARALQPWPNCPHVPWVAWTPLDPPPWHPCVRREHGIPMDTRRCFHMAVVRMALRWSGKRPTKRASLCDGSAWPVVPFGSGGSAAHRLRGAAIPTQRWAICATRRVKWAVALDLDSWTAEQRVVWAAAAEDAEGMPRGVGTGLRSRRGPNDDGVDDESK